MKAITYKNYGAPDLLHEEQVPKPVPKDNEVLFRVKYASVNPMEQHIMGGMPIARLSTGLFRPKHKILGADVSGIVEAVGRKVTGFKPGDEIFGEISHGGFAEFAVATEDCLAIKPANVSFEDAAVTSVAGLTALQGLREICKVEVDERVLVNGASGGVGHFAVQMAKKMGAHVTAVCSQKNHDFVKSIGADDIIDYAKQDFTTSQHKFDVVYDAVGNRKISDIQRVLTKRGRVAFMGFTTIGLLMKNMLLAPFKSSKNGQHFASLTAKANNQDLTTLGQWIADGAIKPQITQEFSMDEIPEALKIIISRRALGKILIKL